MKKVFLILAAFLMLQSCAQIIDEAMRENEQENYQNPFMGKYAGNYSGNLSGTISFDVSKSGNVTITKTTNGTAETFYGFVNHYGAFQDAMGSADAFKLYGNLQTKTGTWKQGTLTGNWTVSKQ